MDLVETFSLCTRAVLLMYTTDNTTAATIIIITVVWQYLLRVTVDRCRWNRVIYFHVLLSTYTKWNALPYHFP
jgi:hypothetical protein